MTEMRAHHSRYSHRRYGDVDLLSVALLVVAAVAIVLVLIGVVPGDVSPWWVLLPLGLAVWNILTLRR
ncbi:NADH-dependent dehydrogenase [Leifsonia xyli subsp. cynodontis DSM 46306]|uniref:Uncharacterized protein n=1 Tax=Leifsonia xyli subsp. cynodontis DSM 46306 TaxID=1389489 RepID=U3P840_LEIXC|nr:NADH-dependent dehydrogenase [Leifsonia xyli subsp. cynodontis DSM 46306]